MRIIIVGCGEIGETILSGLVAEGHDVVAMDENGGVLDAITNIYDVIGVCGNGVDLEALHDAGVERADVLVAVTSSDEKNMLICYLAGKLGAKQTVARIRNPQYNVRKNNDFLRAQLGLSMAINPEMLTAQELFNILKLPSAVKIETFSGGDFEIVELKLKSDSILDGVRLQDLRGKVKAKFLICAVRRENDVYIPDGNFVLRGGDKIALTASPSEIAKLLKVWELMKKQARNIILLGGNKTAYYLAEMLTNGGFSVKIIERNAEVCEELSAMLPKAVVINGDGAQRELLLEEGIASTDAFVALTDMDEENILMSFFAESQKVPKIISQVNKEELAAIAENLGLECIISPKQMIANVLIRYARALENSKGSNVETLYKLMDGQAEALEFNVRSDSEIVNIPLKNMSLRENILITGILRDRTPIIPSGDDVILPNDRVVVFATDGQRLNDLSDILK